MKLTSDRDVFERTTLSQVLPLSTPLVIFIEPARSCNFKCKYCYHSFSKTKAKELNIINEGVMDFDLYTKIIDDIKEFPNKIKCIHLTSRGEPLLNKKLPKMISYAKKQDVAERLNLVTNGLLLSPEMNMELINSGLDSIKISIQAVTEEEYKKIASIKINLQQFIENINHFYENRKDCKLYIKIGDISLKNDNDKQKFHDMFSNICDGISIEHIFDIDNDLSLDLNKKDDKTIYNKQSKKINVCPMPFYLLNIGFDGKVIPCCYYKMTDIGNLSEIKIKELWNGNKMNLFRYTLLKDIKTLCTDCNIPNYNTDEKDNIDECTEQLIRYFEEMRIK